MEMMDTNELPFLPVLLKSIIETINFIVPLLVLIFIGLFLVEILLQTGFLKKFEVITKPLVKIANLPIKCGPPIIAAIGSNLVANAMLQQLKNEKKINDREVLISSILSTIFVPIKEIKFHLSIIMPTLGVYVGGIYVGVMYFGTIVLVAIIILAGRLFLPKRNYDIENLNETYVQNKNKEKEIEGNEEIEQNERNEQNKFKSDKFKRTKFKIMVSSFHASLKTFKKIFTIFVITTFIIFLIINIGVFEYIAKFIGPSSSMIGIPAIAIPALTAYIASPLVGYPMIGALINSHEISENTAIITLLFGSIFMLPIIYLKLYFPQWISIFGFKLGTIRGLISMGVFMLTRGIILLVFLMI